MGRYHGHIDVLAAQVVDLDRRAPGVRVVAVRCRVLELVASAVALGGVGLPAWAPEDDEVEGAEGGEAAADDDAVEFGAEMGWLLVACFGLGHLGGVGR